MLLDHGAAAVVDDRPQVDLGDLLVEAVAGFRRFGKAQCGIPGSGGLKNSKDLTKKTRRRCLWPDVIIQFRPFSGAPVGIMLAQVRVRWKCDDGLMIIRNEVTFEANSVYRQKP